MTMSRIFAALLAPCLALPLLAAAPAAQPIDTHVLTPPAGMETVGDMHGDVAVAPNGDIYVSVEHGPRPGIQVYDARGRYRRNLPGAPTDFHGFVITTAGGRTPYILGARLDAQEVVKMDLDGHVLLRIGAAAVPDRYKSTAKDMQPLNLTAAVAAPNGDIYAVDGYGRDFIHHFSPAGAYLGTFGGPDAPWGFENCHKIAIDPRFDPVRLLCTDRLHGRLVAMTLDGQVIGTIAEALDWPSALATRGEHLAVAELAGRVTVLDRDGKVVARYGANDRPQETKTNEIAPAAWRDTVFYAPHGIAYDRKGNLLVSEWSKWGRVSRIATGRSAR
jgi:hypothetical protein